MWELDYEESWVPKNWFSWTAVLEKTLQSPLDYKEIQPVHPKGDQSWMFIGRTDVEAETLNILATWCEDLTHLKRPWCWERLRAGGEGDDRGWDGWMASPTRRMWVWVNSGSWWLACCDSWGGKESDTTEQLNWTELNWTTWMILEDTMLYDMIRNKRISKQSHLYEVPKVAVSDPRSLQMVTAAMKWKDTCSSEEKLWPT